jgi:DNA-binding GntR family transcriptional regulator
MQSGRLNLAEEIANVVREMIVDGRLPAGQRINEMHLAGQLGISRTPLREALSRLLAEGALSSVARRGFFVRPLSAEEVRSIYPIRALLDPAALRLTGSPAPERLARLREANRRLSVARQAAEAIRLDDLFHLELLEGCPNPVLIELIRQFMWRTRRYELGVMGKSASMSGAVAAHDRILDALEAGDLDLACLELEGNMMRGKQPVLDWLAARVPEEPSR